MVEYKSKDSLATSAKAPVVVKEEAPKQESETSFLQRISQELKNAQTAQFPPTTEKVAREIDERIRTSTLEKK